MIWSVLAVRRSARKSVLAWLTSLAIIACVAPLLMTIQIPPTFWVSHLVAYAVWLMGGFFLVRNQGYRVISFQRGDLEEAEATASRCEGPELERAIEPNQSDQDAVNITTT